MNRRMDVLDRQVYDLISSRGELDGNVPIILLSVSLVVANQDVDEVNKWYEEVRITPKSDEAIQYLYILLMIGTYLNVV